MMNPQTLAAVESFNRSIGPLMVSLYSRWLDEREYESLDDYAALIRLESEKLGAEFKKMNRRPWGFNFILGGHEFQFSINAKRYQIKLIARD